MRHSVLQRIHLIAGLLGLVAFLLTGLFMDRRLDHLVGMPDGPRALYRSGHIYILFSALLNLLLGVYLTTPASRAARVVQYLGSALLLGALFLLLYGFIVETPRAIIERPMIREGIVWSLGGVIAHGVAGLLTLVGREDRAQSREPPAQQHHQ